MFGASRNRVSAKKEQTEQRGGQLLQSSQFTEAAAAFLDAWNMDRTDGQNLLNCGTAIWLEVTEYFKLAGLTAIAGCKCGRPHELFIAFATNPDRVPGGILGDQVRTGAGTKDLEAIRQSLTVAEQCMRLAMTMEKQGNALVWLCHLLRGQARFDECRNEFQNASAAGVLPREVIDEAAPCVERIPDYQSDFEWLTGATGGWTVPDSGKFPSGVARKLGRFTKKLAQQEANVLPDLTPATSASPGSTYVGLWQADEDLRPDGDRDEFLLMCATGLMNALAQRVMPRHPDFQILNKEVTLTREDCGIVFTLSVPSPAHSHILSAEFPIAMQEFVSEMRSAGVTEFLNQFRQYQANSPGGTLPGESAWAPGATAASSGTQPPPLPQAHHDTVGQDARIGFSCNHCGHRMRVKPELAGKKIRCNSCRQITHAPTATHDAQGNVAVGIQISCPHCAASFRVRSSLAGRKIRCKSCERPLRVTARSP